MVEVESEGAWIPLFRLLERVVVENRKIIRHIGLAIVEGYMVANVETVPLFL